MSFPVLFRACCRRVPIRTWSESQNQHHEWTREAVTYSVDSSSAREYQKRFQAFSCICSTLFSPSSCVLRATQLAEGPILANKSAFSGLQSCLPPLYTIWRSLHQRKAFLSLPSSSLFCNLYEWQIHFPVKIFLWDSKSRFLDSNFSKRNFPGNFKYLIDVLLRSDAEYYSNPTPIAVITYFITYVPSAIGETLRSRNYIFN